MIWLYSVLTKFWLAFSFIGKRKDMTNIRTKWVENCEVLGSNYNRGKNIKRLLFIKLYETYVGRTKNVYSVELVEMHISLIRAGKNIKWLLFIELSGTCVGRIKSIYSMELTEVHVSRSEATPWLEGSGESPSAKNHIIYIWLK